MQGNLNQRRPPREIPILISLSTEARHSLQAEWRGSQGDLDLTPLTTLNSCFAGNAQTEIDHEDELNPVILPTGTRSHTSDVLPRAQPPLCACFAGTPLLHFDSPFQQ